MPQPRITREVCQEAMDAVASTGSVSAAAILLDLPRGTVDKRFIAAKNRFHIHDPRTGPPKLSAALISAFDAPVDLPSEAVPVEDLIARKRSDFARKAASRDARTLLPIKVRTDGAYGILHMGDPHLDDDGCDWPTLERHLALIDANPSLFGANVGDLSNNWVGRLARLYANQSTTAAQAWQLVEWFVRRTRWLYIIGGNHDAWSGAADPVKWFARQAGVGYQWHGSRLQLVSPGGAEVRINARHDFAGTSQWNGAHAPAKAARLGYVRDHIYTCGHRHSAAYNMLVWENGEHIAHAVRVGTYKVFDDFSDAKGFPRENLPACVTVINPAAKDAAGLVTTFWDVEAAAGFIRFLRGDKRSIQVRKR